MLKRIVVITIIFTALTAVMTYPLVFRIKDSIMGWYSTDEPFAALWHSWWLKYAFQHRLNENYYSTVAVPFGFDMGKDVLYPVWQFLYKMSSIVTNHFVSFNIQVLLSFVLSGICMYALAFFLTGGSLPAFLSAVIYAFCPYHFARSWQHLGLAQIQWMPLYILSLFRLRQSQNYKNMLLSITALALVLSFEFHYFYFMYIISFLFLGYHFICNKGIDKLSLQLTGRIAVILLIGVIFIIPTSAIISIKRALFENNTGAPSAWGVIRPFDDLFAQSAKPLSYLLPSPAHPIFGAFTEQFLGTSWYGISFTEHILYLGWTPLILAFMAVKKRWGNKELQGKFYPGFFVWLAVTAWLFSQPPWWEVGSVKIYMPSFLMYKIVPMIRGYCRFGILVMLAVAVLAGVGLSYLLQKPKTLLNKSIITMVFCVLVLFEFWIYPPFKLIDMSRPHDVYLWLKTAPEAYIIAEYPLDADSPNEIYKFYQTIHEKRIINGTTPGKYANRVAKVITKLSLLRTAQVLKWMGVKYVLVHREGYADTELSEEIEELNKIPENTGLRLVRSFPKQECQIKDTMCIQDIGPVDVYEVIAGPLEPKVAQ